MSLPGAIRPSDLVDLVERPGPFASVWLGLSGQGAYGEVHDTTKIEEAARQLAAGGAPDSTVEATVAGLEGLEPGDPGAVVVADAGGVRLVERLAEAPRRDVARWTALPSISAVIEHRQAEISVIVILADRLGADVHVRAGIGERRVVDVEGADHPIHRSAPGGWSQRRYQQRAENTWEHNATEVAAEVARLATPRRPDLVVLGGDVRAVEFVEAHLPEALQPIARTIRSGRAADGSEDHREEEVARLVRTTVAERTVALLEQFAEQRAHGLAVGGPAATVDALRRGQAEVLLVHDDPEDDRRAGLKGGVDGRLVDVAVTLALRTGAGVRVVPDAAALDGGIGALLRW